MENLSVVIPFRNGFATIERLLDSLPLDLPVLVVDDQSERPFTTERNNVRLLRPAQRGYFAGAVNAGIAACKTDVLVLNQDVWLEGSAWLDLVAGKRAEFAVLGDGVLNHPAWPRGYVQGTAMFMRRDAINHVGPLNERDYPLWGCTAEWQLRACRLGYKALPVRMSEYGLHHGRGDKSFGPSIQQALADEPGKQKLFVRTPPAVSVVITTYNQGRYLRDAVNALLGGETSLGTFPPQSFQSFEVVIVDDGSPDGTPEIGEALADPWKAVRYIRRTENGGSAAAANTGIAAAFGKYIAMLDGDDLMEPERLEKLYRLAETNEHRFIYDDLTYFANGKRFYWHRLPPYDFELTLKKNQVHKGLLFEKAAWKEVGGYPEIMKWGREDWAMNVRLGAAGYCGVHLAEPLYLYRREGQNRSLTNTEDIAWRRKFVEQLHSLFPNLYAGERPMACCGGGRSRAASRSANGGSAVRAVSVRQTVNERLSGAKGAAESASLARRARGGVFVGSEGMEPLEYLPERAGMVSYYGSVTHAAYVFGGGRKVALVDVRDVPAFLALRENNRPVFRIPLAPRGEVVVTQPEPVPEPAAAVTTEANLPSPEASANSVQYPTAAESWVMEDAQTGSLREANGRALAESDAEPITEPMPDVLPDAEPVAPSPDTAEKPARKPRAARKKKGEAA